MANYTTNIPALAPLASGANDNQAPDIQQGDPLNANHVTAAVRQHKNRKQCAMMDAPQATAAEVVASKRRKHEVESCNFDGATPLWAQQMQQQMAQMQQQMQQQMAQLERQMERESQRSMNRSRRSNADRIAPVIRLTDGTTPPAADYPADQVALHTLQGQPLDNLLGFYQIQLQAVASVTDKRQALAAHLGVTL